MQKEIKLLRHYENIKGIANAKLLPPVMVDIDPVDGACNLDCDWCCQAASRFSKSAHFMSIKTMQKLGTFCKNWGVKAWRISGDSEPLLNKNINTLMQSGHENGIDMGLITNGVFLERIINLEQLTWLGVSLDATTPETWSKLKRDKSENFHKIIANIKNIRKSHPTLEISIKFLRWSKDKNASKTEFATDSLPIAGQQISNHPNNYQDAETLDEFAASLGCQFILKDAYPKDFPQQYKFRKCWATPLGGVFAADHKYHLCCDARSVYVLTDDYTRNSWKELPALWGTEKHLNLIKSINPQQCAGCAKYKTNEIIENIVLNSDTTDTYQVNFI